MVKQVDVWHLWTSGRPPQSNRIVLWRLHVEPNVAQYRSWDPKPSTYHCIGMLLCLGQWFRHVLLLDLPDCSLWCFKVCSATKTELCIFRSLLKLVTESYSWKGTPKRTFSSSHAIRIKCFILDIWDMLIQILIHNPEDSIYTFPNKLRNIFLSYEIFTHYLTLCQLVI